VLKSIHRVSKTEHTRQNVLSSLIVLIGTGVLAPFHPQLSRKQNHEVQLCAFDVLATDGEDMRDLPLSMARPTLSGYYAAGLMAFSSTPSSKVRLGRISSVLPLTWG
jgi:bifunctional non-homologous end joining protein LigD